MRLRSGGVSSEAEYEVKEPESLGDQVGEEPSTAYRTESADFRQGSN